MKSAKAVAAIFPKGSYTVTTGPIAFVKSVKK